MSRSSLSYDESVIDDVVTREYEKAQKRLLEICDQKKYGVAFVAGESDSGKKLKAQVMRIGERKARTCMVLCSGVSGVGGIFVSHLYSDLLGSLQELPADFSLLVVNAVNPEGAVWPPHFLPQNVIQKRWQNPILQDVEARVARDNIPYEQKQKDLFSGRVRPVGGAAWEERVLKEIYHQFLIQADRVVSLDIRPSFQTFGKIDLWSCCDPNDKQHGFLRKWFRRLQPESLYDFYANYGKHASVGPAVFVDKEHLISMRVECGTYTPADVLGSGNLGGGLFGGLLQAETATGRSLDSMQNESKLYTKDHPYWQILKKEVQGIWDVLVEEVQHI